MITLFQYSNSFMTHICAYVCMCHRMANDDQCAFWKKRKEKKCHRICVLFRTSLTSRYFAKPLYLLQFISNLSSPTVYYSIPFLHDTLTVSVHRSPLQSSSHYDSSIFLSTIISTFLLLTYPNYVSLLFFCTFLFHYLEL